MLGQEQDIKQITDGPPLGHYVCLVCYPHAEGVARCGHVCTIILREDFIPCVVCDELVLTPCPDCGSIQETIEE